MERFELPAPFLPGVAESLAAIRAPGARQSPVRFVRVVAFDPLCSDGKRVHQKLGVGFDPAFTLQTFLDVLNYGAGETVYAPEGGSIEAAVHYTTSVPYQVVTNAYAPFTFDPNSPVVHLTGDQFAAMLSTRGPWPYEQQGGNAGLSMLLDPGYVGFNLADDVNAQKFHLLIFACPGAGGDEGAYTGLAEAYMIAGPGDQTAIATNGGIWPVHGVQPGRKVVMVMSNLTRGPDLTVHSWIHAHIDAGVLRRIWDWGVPTDDVQTISSPLSLWMANGDPTSLHLNGRNGIEGGAGAGDAHRNPNSFTDYGLSDADVVPSNADMWLTYPDGPGWSHGRMDLDNNARRQPYRPAVWMGLTQFPDYCRCQAWQLRRIPRGQGQIDGRWADWWRYLLDANEQTGMGLPITSPVVGPKNGARDLRLEVQNVDVANRRVTLSWDISQEDDPGSYAVMQWMGQDWEILGGGLITPRPHAPARISYQEVVPADKQVRFYAVLWYSDHGTFASDVLAVVPGMSGGNLAVADAGIALYQSRVAYVTTRDMQPLVAGGTLRLVDMGLTEVMRVDVFPGQVMYSLADQRPNGEVVVSGYYIGSFSGKGDLIGWSDLVGVCRGIASV